MTLETKMQIEVLKALEKDKRILWTRFEDGSTMITSDGIWAIRISKKDFFLDLSKITESGVFSKLLESMSYATLLHVTNEIKVCDAKNVRILECEKFKVGINENYLANYKKGPYQFYTTGGFAPILITLDNEVVATVCPVRI